MKFLVAISLVCFAAGSSAAPVEDSVLKCIDDVNFKLELMLDSALNRALFDEVKSKVPPKNYLEVTLYDAESLKNTADCGRLDAYWQNQHAHWCKGVSEEVSQKFADNLKNPSQKTNDLLRTFAVCSQLAKEHTNLNVEKPELYMDYDYATEDIMERCYNNLDFTLSFLLSSTAENRLLLEEATLVFPDKNHLELVPEDAKRFTHVSGCRILNVWWEEANGSFCNDLSPPLYAQFAATVNDQPRKRTNHLLKAYSVCQELAKIDPTYGVNKETAQ